MKWFGFLRKLSLWVVLLPWVIWGVGFAMNQACLVRNGGRFPCLWTSAQFWETQQDYQLELDDPTTPPAERIVAAKRIEEMEHGFLDDRHVWMNRDWKNPNHTWWNWLGDWITFGGGTAISPGDCLIWGGRALVLPMIFAWAGILAERFRKE